MIFFENISKVLNRKLKEEKVISQVEFANRLGVTPVAVNKWLKGGAIESSKIPMICEILNITPNELFGIENELDSDKALKLYEAYKEHPEFQKSIDILLGIDIISGLQLGYSCELPTNKLLLESYGSHEIYLAYGFDILKPKRTNKYKSIRYL